jgi:uncharacterized protein
MFRPVHFEIPVTDVERAMAFYSNVLHWKFTKWEGPQPYWLINTGEGAGINGGLLIRPGAGQGGTVNTVDVPNVDEYAAMAEKNGGKIVVPKMAIPGVGWLVYCTDPDGNIFGMMQNDTAAR